MKTYRLITINPLKLATKSVAGKPTSVQVADGYSVPSPPYVGDHPLFTKYAYVEELGYPSLSADEGNIWTRELTLSAYGWTQTPAPPEPNPEWYIQPAWRIRAIADVTPFGGGLLIDAITAAIDAIVDPLEKAVAKEVFFGGNILERDSAVLVAMAAGLGLTDEQLDDLFQQAHAIVV